MTGLVGEDARCRVVIGEQRGEPVECGAVEAIHGDALGMVGGHAFQAGEDAVAVECRRCAGTGEFPPTGGDECSWCGGEGYTVERQSGRGLS